MTGALATVPTTVAARILGLSASTLAKMRLTGRGPYYCKLGRRVLYRPNDLAEWLEGHVRQSTSDTIDGEGAA